MTTRKHCLLDTVRQMPTVIETACAIPVEAQARPNPIMEKEVAHTIPHLSIELLAVFSWKRETVFPKSITYT